MEHGLSRFQVAVHGWNIGVVNMEGERESGSQVRDELGIRDGAGAANPVLDMDHAEGWMVPRSNMR